MFAYDGSFVCLAVCMAAQMLSGFGDRYLTRQKSNTLKEKKNENCDTYNFYCSLVHQ